MSRFCSRDDMAEADRLAEMTVGRAERDRFLAPLRAAAMSLVADAWPTICELATLLVDQRRLPGAFVEAWLDDRSEVPRLRDYYSAAFATPAAVPATTQEKANHE